MSDRTRARREAKARAKYVEIWNARYREAGLPLCEHGEIPVRCHADGCLTALRPDNTRMRLHSMRLAEKAGLGEPHPSAR